MYWIKRLSFIALSGELAANYLPTLRKSRPEDTAREIRLAIEFFRKLAERRPGTFDADLAELLERQSRLLNDIGRGPDAVKHCDEALEIRRKVLARTPTTARKRERLASCLEIISTYHRSSNLATSALESTKEAIELRRDIAAEYSDDSHVDLQRSLNIISFLRCLHSLADDLRDLDRLPEALPIAEERVDISREMAESEPDVFNATLAESLYHLSYVLRDLGRYQEACDAVEEAVTLQRLIAARDPTILGDLAFSLHHMSFTLRDVGNVVGALLPAENAVSIRRSLAEVNPVKFNPLLAHSLSALSLALRVMGRHENALLPSQEAIAIQRQLVSQDPMQFKPDLAAFLNTISYHFAAVGKAEAALHATDEALQIQRELTEADPVNFTVNANFLDTRANLLSSLGRHEEALQTIDEAEELNRTKSTEPAGLVRERSAVYWATRAKCLLGLGRQFDALSAITEALAIYRQVAEQSPTIVSPVFSDSVDAILGCLEQLKSTELMVKLVELCRLLSKHAPGRFNAPLKKVLLAHADSIGGLDRDGEAAQVLREAEEVQI
ncbi:hypothetical protein C8R43DRAFT_894346 [Mycena crocata]|nr:hypothetical protein C8R43DRAFT_894346 [Mycena crocata]